MHERLAIIDYDGVIAGNEKRMEMARTTPTGAIDWKVAFDPDLVVHDVLIAQADEHIERLREEGFTVLVLTSRPESMREASQAWFIEHGVVFEQRFLIMKPPCAQYIKTLAWKTSVIDLLAHLFEAEVVLYVDDDEKNMAEVIKHLSNQRYRLVTYTSLADVFKNTWEE